MASQVTKRGPVKPSLNITPLIDVVFLLIVFFMLVQTIKQDEVPPLQLPDIDHTLASVVESKNRLIVNVLPVARWEGDSGPGAAIGAVLARPAEARAVSFGGQEYLIDDAEAIKKFRIDFADAIRGRIPKGEIKFFLRADAAIRSSAVMLIMQQMQAAMTDANLEAELGAGTLHLVAYRDD